MRFLLSVACALILSLAGAKTYTYGVWSFELPDDARASVQDGVRAFGYDGVVYLFTPPESLAGRTLEQVAGTTIADLTRNQTSSVKLAGNRADGGTTLLAYSGAVTDPKTGTSRIQVYFFFEKAGLWGLALAMVDVKADADAGKALAPLGTVKFSPSSQVARSTTGPGEIPAPRLPALPWATAPANRIATSRPAIDYPAARKLNLDPDVDPLPDIFECYLGKNDDDKGQRPMTPTPDLRVAFSKDGSYAYNDGVTRSAGRWAQKIGDDKRKLTTLSGPLVTGSRFGIYLYDDDAGQRFIATQSGTGREVRCYQAGPRAEAVRLELTRLRIGDGPLSCVGADGPAFPLTFSGSGSQMTYSTPKGNGRVQTSFSSSSENWRGQAGFSGGPFDLAVGEMTEDDLGNRTLTISESTTTRGMFYSETNTQRIALCRAKVPPRPDVLYGQNPAPKTGVSGGPDGLYVSSQSVSRYTGMFFFNVVEAQLSLFTSGGSVMTDLDPDELGTLPDCTRTKPNGDPFCERYSLKSGALLMPGDDKAQAYKPTADGFELGDTEYYRAAPPTAKTLPGVYDSNSDSSSGAQGGGTDIGVYSSLSSGYRFTADGQFSWKYSSSSSTLLSPNSWGSINGYGATGGGSSTSSGGGQGSYTLDGHWLTLNFSDGRKLRRFVYQQPAAMLQADPTLGSRLNIGGSWLRRVGKP